MFFCPIYFLPLIKVATVQELKPHRMERSITYGYLSAMLVLSLLGFAGSDVASDRNECTSQLIGLSTCLPYAQGKANVPTKNCCDGLKQVLVSSKKCLCILIKDSKDPNLGITINTTLAVMLPDACHAPSNISECPDLLHLAPNSTEAQIFKQLQGSSPTTAAANVNTSKSPAEVKSSGTRIGGKRRLWGLEMIAGLWIWCVVSMLTLGG